MTRQEAIERWKEIVSTVFWAEEKIAHEWDKKLRDAVNLPKDEQHKLADDYCRAIATEIVSKTTEEQLAAIS